MDNIHHEIIQQRKRDEFLRLYQEFSNTYPGTRAGKEHINYYASGRKQGRENYERILTAYNRGEDVTDLVLKKLLPHNDNEPNRQAGAWIHVAPSIIKDIKSWYEGAGWVSPEDWPKISKAILDFVQRCVDDPNRLEEACNEFAGLPYSTGFQTGTLTPILNALRPDDFVLANNKPRRLFNYFTDSSFTQKLTDYPKINSIGKQLIDDLSNDMVEISGLKLLPGDLFDMFSHWLVAVKKYHFDEKGTFGIDHSSSQIHEEREIYPSQESTIVGERIEHLLGRFIDRESPNPNCTFTPKSFELLSQIHENPTNEFYQARKEEFKSQVEEPFKQLMRNVAAILPDQIKDVMETEKKIFSRFTKNDFGQGGAWDFYWGAFYTKGGNRIEDAQLSMWMNHEGLELGFYIGDYGKDARGRFEANSRKYLKELMNFLEPIRRDEFFLLGSHHNFTITPNGTIVANEKMSWEEWFKDPNSGDYDASVLLSRQQVLKLSEKELMQLAVQVFQRLFPLVLLTVYDDPLPWIARYLNVEERDDHDINAVYTLVECSQRTGINEGILKRWVRAIERKKQAIFYGPPGTGKTFIAEHLARHLIGGGDGFVDLVQFHPAYAYEDFIQGIRPESNPDRGLEYPVVPGRFLRFCRKAEGREGLCVLIIDEINRANLARVFGELMYLLEYREREIPLSGGGRFRIPDNVRILGTMNTADRSIALVDHALRRRFAFLALYPDFDILRQYHRKHETGFPVENLISTLERLNRQIGDRHYEVGISFFLREDLDDQIEDIWRMEIEPYLEEYFFDQSEKVASFRWDKIGPQIES
jgi:5-methylcytosine-specific restriction protein B